MRASSGSTPRFFFLFMKVYTNTTHTTYSEEQKNKLKEVAASYEKEFVRQMVKAMKSTVTESNLIKKNQAEKIFSEDLYNSYADSLAEKGGMGLKEHIYKNLLEKFGPQLGIPQEGPPSLDKKLIPLDTKILSPQKPPKGKNLGQMGMEWRFYLSDQFSGGGLQSSVNGLVRNVKQLGDSFFEVDVENNQGTIFNYKFKGRPLVQESQEIKEDSILGELSPESREVKWTIWSDKIPTKV